ncbi:pilus assembly protein PilP [Desulfonatronovibrio hydrogenovorans]|uniref:pilus assembly protein PilP n=1 Tax=Desulfonatronovibrio hydrogenovorans TaxID=53245 RepID=UPI000691D62C|nr:pilus assembly protein PilP [Desulfonatronovibrio hydrogenovorans]
MARFIPAVAGLVFMLGIQNGFPALSNAEQNGQWVEPDWITPSAYYYNPEGLADPFTPFIQPRIQEPPGVDDPPRRPLTPLEQIEVSQLKLVGVIWQVGESREPTAMVELPDGKGFILKLGTVVGRNRGEVRDITSDQVVVVERITNIFGATEDRRTVLRLRPGQVD